MPTQTRRTPVAAKAPSRRAATRTKAAKPAKPVSAAPAPVAAPPASAASTARGNAKVKPVRDSFTMPPDDHALIGQIKQRALKLQHPAKKSEVLRAGLKALAAMDDRTLQAVLEAVPPLKTGRPKQADTKEQGKTSKAAAKTAKIEKAGKAEKAKGVKKR
jgi:hypothetical protein